MKSLSLKTYNQNGVVTNENYLFTFRDKFAVQEFNGRYHYYNDYIVMKIDAEFVELYDIFGDMYFGDSKEYDQITANMPMVLSIGGHNSEVPVSKNKFLQMVDVYSSNINDLYRYIYVDDCRYLISTVQNLLQAIEYCYVQYFIQISKVEFEIDLVQSSIFQQISQLSTHVAFFVETIFIKMYSVLDLLVKIIYELENPMTSFENITKLRSAEKLWGFRKNLSINNLQGSIFEDCKIIRTIESLRNEVVHNGTWEFRAKVFVEVEGKNVVERYMLFPDLEDGRLASVKNRKHFFSSGKKVNEILVDIHDEFYRRLFFTIKYIKEKYTVDKCDQTEV